MITTSTPKKTLSQIREELVKHGYYTPVEMARIENSSTSNHTNGNDTNNNSVDQQSFQNLPHSLGSHAATMPSINPRHLVIPDWAEVKATKLYNHIITTPELMGSIKNAFKVPPESDTDFLLRLRKLVITHITEHAQEELYHEFFNVIQALENQYANSDANFKHETDIMIKKAKLLRYASHNPQTLCTIEQHAQRVNPELLSKAQAIKVNTNVAQGARPTIEEQTLGKFICGLIIDYCDGKLDPNKFIPLENQWEYRNMVFTTLEPIWKNFSAENAVLTTTAHSNSNSSPKLGRSRSYRDTKKWGKPPNT